MCVQHKHDMRAAAKSMLWGALLLAVSTVWHVRVHATPDPTIALASGQNAITASSVIKFAVTFTEPVTGLRASDFCVSAGKAGVEDVSLVGAGAEYELTVTLGDGDTRGCPAGFLASSDGPMLCAKSTPAGTWSEVNAACAPFTLTSATTTQQVALVARAAAEVRSTRHWYVSPARLRTAVRPTSAVMR